MEQFVKLEMYEGYQITEELYGIKAEDLPEGILSIETKVYLDTNSYEQENRVEKKKTVHSIQTRGGSANIGNWLVKNKTTGEWTLYSDEQFIKYFHKQ